MSTRDRADSPRPWHRVPLMWLVAGIPTLTVVAGLLTLTLAIRGGDVVVRDDYRKEGLAIYVDPVRDAAATAAGARASLAFDRDAGQLRAVLSLERGPLPDGLLVVLSHATRAELDRLVFLPGADGEYRGRLEPLPGGRWHLELTPHDRSWRLRGEFSGGQPVVELQAAGGR